MRLSSLFCLTLTSSSLAQTSNPQKSHDNSVIPSEIVSSEASPSDYSTQNHPQGSQNPKNHTNPAASPNTPQSTPSSSSQVVSRAIEYIDPTVLYNEALRIRREIPPPEANLEMENAILAGKFYVPQYSTELKDYEECPLTKNRPVVPNVVINKVIPLLEKAASLGHTDSMVELADIYMLGHHSVPQNFSRAIQLYHQSVKYQGNGHSYFMLGYVYASGLFGEVEVDQVRANLYYQLGMEHGDSHSIMALAYRNLNGIGFPINHELALFYYAKLAQKGMDNLNSFYDSIQDDVLSYDIRISDFNGGLYGDKLSETRSSIDSKVELYSNTRRNFAEFNIDLDDHEYVNLYLNALKYYDGDYFLPSNRTKAKEYLEQCISLGDRMYSDKQYKAIGAIDKTFLSFCYSKLGNMYLKGYGVEKNLEKSKYLHEVSVAIEKTGQSLNDLGLIAQTTNETVAIEYFVSAIKRESNQAKLNLAKLLTEISQKDPSKGDYAVKIYESIRDSAFGGVTESLYHFGEFSQSGFTQQMEPGRTFDIQSTIMYFKIFVERLERYFLPELRHAFEDFKLGNLQNALIGYSIAAELGMENAQVSTAYLLYQLQPLRSDYKVKNFSVERIKSSIKYLERSSSQNNIDSTILLGDLYLKGIDNALGKDYNKAFKYYKKATNQRSSHAAYKLGYMYEYGLGTVNNSIDYFIAKRYYDYSMELKEEGLLQVNLSNKVPIHWALLRLRFKHLFSKSKGQEEKNSWLSAFKKIGRSGADNTEAKAPEVHQSNRDKKAAAHHEGLSYEDHGEYGEYDIGDYVVISLTLLFFVGLFVQNIVRQFRRVRNNRNGNNENNEGNENNVEPQERNRIAFAFGINGFQFNGEF